MSEKKSIFNLSRPHVFIPMSADLFHHGHINILLKAKKLGNTIVGLMTDKGIKSYKGKVPLINFVNRKKILKQIKCVDCILPINGLEYEKFAKRYKFDFFVHGKDWRNGPQSKERLRLIRTMKKWGGRVIEVNYTKGISSSYIKKKL